MEAMKSLIPIPEIAAPEEEVSAHKEDVIPMVKAEVSVSEESMRLETEGPVPENNMAPGVEMEPRLLFM